MRFLLLSLPWTDYQGPSLPIGSLAAYARSKGFDVDARHLHLEAAAQFGFNDFNRVTYDAPAGVGEAICAALLFPREQKALLKSAAQYIPNAHLFAKRMLKTLRKLYNRTAWKDYSLVGLTVSCEQLFSSLLMVSWIKRDFPHIRTVLGGRLVAGELGKSVLKHFGQIDWCVDGEGEKAFISLLKALQDGRRSFENEVPGLMYRCNGRIMNNPRQQLSDLSGLPDSDFDHYFQTLSTHPRLRNRDASPYIPVEAGRGCIYSCAFCSVKPFWHEHRHRPSAEVAVSIDRMSRRYSDHAVHRSHDII